jgi:multimeric flavodoxin WrbA
MKLLGLSFGTKLGKGPMGGTNEILVKEALMTAEEMGVEVGFIRMLDYDIKPCKGCTACVMSLFQGGDGRCAIKDELPLIEEQVMESDGLIISAPVYVLGPTGLLKVIADRWGPSHDTYWRMQAKKIAATTGKKGPDERSFKNRVAGLMCTGGASTPHWVGLGLPLMYLMCFSQHITVVDGVAVFPGSFPSMRSTHLVLNEEVLARARKMGRNVVEAMKKPIEQVKWMGDEPGTCPVCHLNLLTVTTKNLVECPICGIRGELKIKDGEISVTFSKEEQAHSRLNIQGLKDHWDELTGEGEISGSMLQQMQMQKADEIAKRKKKYIGYREIKKPKGKSK